MQNCLFTNLNYPLNREQCSRDTADETFDLSSFKNEAAF
jgi:hypothetical protein